MLVVGRPPDPQPGGAARRAASGCVGRGARCSRSPTGRWSLRERRRPLGELAAARTSFQTGRVRTTLLARHGRHLQPDRGAADRLRTDVRARALTPDRRRGSTCAASSAPPARGARLSSDFGYGARAELRFAGRRGGRAGSTARWRRSRTSRSRRPENGWSAFLLQRDYRDYFERRAAAAAAWVQPTRVAPGRAVAPARPRALGAGHRSLVAASATATAGAATR